MSYSKPRPEVFTCEDIINAYNEHGDDFIIIPPDSKRDWKTYQNYLDINIKKVNGEIVNLLCLKTHPNEELSISTNIRDPTLRQYEQIRISLPQYDDKGTETITMRALNIICTSFKNVFKKMVADNVFTHHKNVPRKKNKDGVLRPVLLINTDPITPIQTTRVNKNTQEVEELDIPVYWIDIPKKPAKRGVPASEPEQFGSLYYKEDDGSDGKNPFIRFPFKVQFEEIPDPKNHPEIRVPVGDMDEDGNVVLDNTNIHKYVTKDKLLLGAFKFEIKVSSRGAKINVELFDKMTIKDNPEKKGSVNQIQTDDDIKAFAALNLNSSTTEVVNEEEIIEEESDEEEFDT